MYGSNDFDPLFRDLAGLMARLPPSARWTVRREILASLNRMAQLLANLEAERADLERSVALLEAEVIVAGKSVIE